MSVAETAGVFDLVIFQREQVAQLSGTHTHTMSAHKQGKRAK